MGETSGSGKAPGDQARPGSEQTGEVTCPDCHGSGRRGQAACRTCAGTGMVTQILGDA